MSLQINTQQIQGVHIVTLTGRLDTMTEPDFEEQVLPLANHTRLLLDMTGVEYMSSAGLKALLLLHRQTSTTQGRLVLVGVNENIQNILSLTGVAEFFPTYRTVSERLSALQ